MIRKGTNPAGVQSVVHEHEGESAAIGADIYAIEISSPRTKGYHNGTVDSRRVRSRYAWERFSKAVGSKERNIHTNPPIPIVIDGDRTVSIRWQMSATRTATSQPKLVAEASVMVSSTYGNCR
jgi:hypothetical protein